VTLSTVANSAVIRAAGGVVWRERAGEVQVAVVHRPRYDDWTLPKGKLKRTESSLDGAVREVREEIGSQVAVGRLLISVDYVFAGQPKTVAFWSMREIEGHFVAGPEVDEVAWLPPDEARTLVSYGIYRDVIDDFQSVPVPHALIILVRHAKAGKRSSWAADDRDRPLDRAGRRQAERLAQFLLHFSPDRIVSADRTRCVQTMDPLAERLGIPIEVSETFTDEAFVEDPGRVERQLLGLGKPGSAVVVCSQGTAIPGLLSQLPIRPPIVDVTTH